jgi:hypothetical protein
MKYKKTATHANGQAKDVQKAIAFLFKNIAKRCC